MLCFMTIIIHVFQFIVALSLHMQIKSAQTVLSFSLLRLLSPSKMYVLLRGRDSTMLDL